MQSSASGGISQGKTCTSRLLIAASAGRIRVQCLGISKWMPVSYTRRVDGMGTVSLMLQFHQVGLDTAKRKEIVAQKEAAEMTQSWIHVHE